MIVAVANTKGGVGKSTIANLIAQKLDLPIKNLDAFQDPYLYTEVEEYKSGDGYVLDAGGFLDKRLRAELEKADAVVVPMLPSPRDFVPTLNFLEWLFGFYDKRVLIVANKATEQKAENVKRALYEALEQIDEINADVRFSRLPKLESIQTWELERKRWLDHLKVWNRSQRKAAEYVEDFAEALRFWIENE